MAGNIVLEFPSEYKFLNLVDVVCGEVVHELCDGQALVNEISISVIEAVTNAIEHGNRECRDQNVRVRFSCKADRLCVEVTDCGRGFDYECYLQNIPDPADLKHVRGRGIYIMKNMMDGLEFEVVPGEGMTVKLEKLLKPTGTNEGQKD